MPKPLILSGSLALYRVAAAGLWVTQVIYVAAATACLIGTIAGPSSWLDVTCWVLLGCSTGLFFVTAAGFALHTSRTRRPSRELRAVFRHWWRDEAMVPRLLAVAMILVGIAVLALPFVFRTHDADVSQTGGGFFSDDGSGLRPTSEADFNLHHVANVVWTATGAAMLFCALQAMLWRAVRFAAQRPANQFDPGDIRPERTTF